MTLAAKANNCNALNRSDSVRCRVVSKEIAIGAARDLYHSFGGTMPPEPAHGSITVEEKDASIYPRESYAQFDNRAICDVCGHSCI